MVKVAGVENAPLETVVLGDIACGAFFCGLLIVVCKGFGDRVISPGYENIW